MAAKSSNEPETLADLQSPFQSTALPMNDIDPDSRYLQLDDMPPFDMGWAAGFFDGEGCISIARQQIKGRRLPSFHLRASIWQNDRRVLEHFRDGVGAGGAIHLAKHRAYYSRPVYVLSYPTWGAMLLLKRLGPHLVRKRDEAMVAQRFWREGDPVPDGAPRRIAPETRALREQLYREMSRLKRAPVPD